MSESSSSGSQGNQNQGSRNRSQGGNRNRNGNSGGNRSGGQTNAERARRPVPEQTGFQKFVKAITFGLVDLKPKRGGGKKGGSSKPGEKRGPRLIEPTSPRLYVGNLNYDATEDELKEYFAATGEVKDVTIISQPGGRSKGFGFIEMGSLEEAKNASFSLNDKEFKGRKMLVTGAKPEKKRDDARRDDRRSEPREGGGGDRPQRSGGRPSGARDGRRDSGRPAGDRVEKPTRTVKALEIEVVTSPQLKLSQVNATATDEDITDLFMGIGTLQKHDAIGEAGEDAATRDYTIELTDVAEAQKAVEFLHDKTFMGHKISVTGVTAE